jgi:uncharacterized YigZ family protein
VSDETYRTPAGRSRHEIDKVKGSRFLATVAPVRTEDEAQALLAEIRRELHDARHHAWAWRLGRAGERFRYSDDGEPSGSAGRPILQQLEGREICDAIVVVTRWFGGTKLGVGGLMRAYGAAAGEALDRARIRTVTLTERLTLEYAYEHSGPMEGLLSEFGLVPAAATYEATVRLELDVPLSRVAPFLRAFQDRTAGRGRRLA